jgi:hypothetical protein
MDVHGVSLYPFPPPAVWTLDVQGISISKASDVDMLGAPFFHHQQYGRAGCTLSTTSSVNVQGVSHSIACNVGLQPAGCTFLSMSDCPESGQSGTGMNKNADAETNPVPG